MQTPADSFFLDPEAPGYSVWLKDLRPRTCLLMHWLADLGAVREPGAPVRRKAARFAEKRTLLGRIVDESNPEASRKTVWLLDNGDFDLYVAWLMWLRFQEYIPGRFVLPQGREKVLSWVREQLRRPELTDFETLGELQWQVERLHGAWGDSQDDPR